MGDQWPDGHTILTGNARQQNGEQTRKTRNALCVFKPPGLWSDLNGAEVALAIRNDTEWHQSYELTTLFIAHQLGPKPRRVADRNRAIDRASDELDAREGEEAVRARRFLAIEYLAYAGDDHRGRGGRPSIDDWATAIRRVDAAPDEEVRQWARGGMVVRVATTDAWLPATGE